MRGSLSRFRTQEWQDRDHPPIRPEPREAIQGPHLYARLLVGDIGSATQQGDYEPDDGGCDSSGALVTVVSSLSSTVSVSAPLSFGPTSDPPLEYIVNTSRFPLPRPPPLQRICWFRSCDSGLTEKGDAKSKPGGFGGKWRVPYRYFSPSCSILSRSWQEEV